MIKQTWQKIFSFSLIYALIRWTGQSIIEEQNEYSIRHYEYNELTFNINLQTHVILLVGIYSMNNFGIRIGVKCLDVLLLLILMVMRTAMILYQFIVLLPLSWKFIKMTYYLNQENWWKHPDEPFFTNCSIFNAILCWVMWLVLRFYIFLFMYIFPVILITQLIKFRMG